jgi:hypothetical protein
VAQSLAGFTAPLVAKRIPVEMVVLVAAMVPRAGESPGQWWANTGHVFPDPFDPLEVFCHDLPRLTPVAHLGVGMRDHPVGGPPRPLCPFPRCRSRRFHRREPRTARSLETALPRSSQVGATPATAGSSSSCWHDQVTFGDGCGVSFLADEVRRWPFWSRPWTSKVVGLDGHLAP